MLVGLDVVEHRRGDRPAFAAEQVERHAAGRGVAQVHVAERELEVADVEAVEEGLLGLVLGMDVIHVPGRAVAEPAIEAEVDVPGIDVPGEDARPQFDRTLGDPAEVLARHEVDSERVVRVVRRNHDRIGDAAGAGERTDEDRFRRGLVGRLAVVVQRLGVQRHRIVDVVARAGEDRLALGGRQQQVERREVEAVRAAPVVVGAGTAGRAAAVVVRRGGAVVQRDVEPVVAGRVATAVTGGRQVGVAEGEAAPRRRRVARADARAGYRPDRTFPLVRADALEST